MIGFQTIFIRFISIYARVLLKNLNMNGALSFEFGTVLMLVAISLVIFNSLLF